MLGLDIPWRLLEEVGKGKFGCVWKANAKSTGDTVAVKFSTCAQVRSVLDKLGSSLTIDSEVAVLRMLQHSSIVAVHAYTLVEDYMCFSMPYFERGSVFDLLFGGSCLSDITVGFHLRELLLDACYMHVLRVVHRDIKPANIMISARGGRSSWVLIDFGLAKVGDCYTCVGTPGFMAPEVYLASSDASEISSYVKKADIWSLGMTAYQTITAQPAFAQGDERNATLNNEMIWDDEEWLQCCPVFKELVVRML